MKFSVILFFAVIGYYLSAVECQMLLPEKMLKKYIFIGCGGEEQLYFHCPDYRIYSDAYTSRD